MSLSVPSHAVWAVGTVDVLTAVPISLAPGAGRVGDSLLTHRLALWQRCPQPLHHPQESQGRVGQRGERRVKGSKSQPGFRTRRSAGGVMLSMGTMA